MGPEEKEKMIQIIDKYISDENYRKYINSTDISKLSIIEQIALKDLLVSSDGIEIVNSDLSNHYDPYNPIDISTPEAVRTTCMNMAIGTILHSVFEQNKVHNFSNFGLPDIKTRIKGDLISTKDKPAVIEFIRYYYEQIPTAFAQLAENYWDMYQLIVNTGVDLSTFLDLAMTYNTNIYLYELSPNNKKFTL